MVGIRCGLRPCAVQSDRWRAVRLIKLRVVRRVLNNIALALLMMASGQVFATTIQVTGDFAGAAFVNPADGSPGPVGNISGGFDITFDDSQVPAVGVVTFAVIPDAFAFTPDPLEVTSFNALNTRVFLTFDDGTLVNVEVGGLINGNVVVAGSDDFLAEYDPSVQVLFDPPRGLSYAVQSDPNTVFVADPQAGTTGSYAQGVAGPQCTGDCYFDTTGGIAFVGQTDVGDLLQDDGSTAFTAGLSIGEVNGVATLSNGSQLTLRDDWSPVLNVLNVGVSDAGNANGVLDIESGAGVMLIDAALQPNSVVTIGSGPNSTGTVSVTGTDATGPSQLVAGGLLVGNNGATGTLNVLAGGTVQMATASVAEGAGSTAVLVVSDVTSSLQIATDLQVGNGIASNVDIDVLNGGLLDVAGSLTVNDAAAGVDILVDGVGSNLRVGGGVLDLSESTSLVVSNGGQLDVSGTALLSGTVQVDTASLSLSTGTTTGSSLNVGRESTGVLDVNGGTVSLDASGLDPAAGDFRFAVGAGGDGSVSVSGGGSINVLDAATGGRADGVYVGASVSAGQELAGVGQLSINGTGSTVNVQGNDAFVEIGSANTTGQSGVALGAATADGSLLVTDGAALIVQALSGTAHLDIARGASTTGLVEVSGTDSIVDVVGDPGASITVAALFDDAFGELNVLAGATVNTQSFSAGVGPGSSSVANVLIDGIGSSLNADVLQFASGSTLTLVNGAQLNATTSMTINDTALISGVGTQLGVTELVVGSDVDGFVTAVLNVTDAAVVAVADAQNPGGGVFRIGVGDVDATVQVDDAAMIDVDGMLTLGNMGVASGLFPQSATLVINDTGSVTALDTVIGQNGLLAGTGTLISDVLVGAGGSVGPGNSPGTLNIVGAFTLDGGLLAMELGGPGPGESDLLNITGTFEALSGEIRLDLINGYQPAIGDSFDFIVASGGITLDPGVVVNITGNTPRFEVLLSADLTTATLQFIRSLLDIGTTPGLTANQASLARALDSLCPRLNNLSGATPDEQDLGRLCLNVKDVDTTRGQLATALDQINPEELTAAITTLLRFPTQQHGNLSQRINGLRSGASRIDVTGLNFQFDGGTVAGRDLQRVAEKWLGGGGASADEDFPRWGLFGDAAFNEGDKNVTVNEAGFGFDSTFITLGADYRLRDTLFVGGALGYSNIDADFDAGGGMELDSLTLSSFITYYQDQSFYVDGLVSYSVSDFETARSIRYEDVGGTVTRSAEGTTEGDQLSISVGTGYDFNRGPWTFGPHGGFNYLKINVDAFEETTAMGLNLALSNQSAESQTLNLGFHASRTLLPSWGVLVPHVRGDYVREFQDNAETIAVRFVNDRFAFDPMDPTPLVEIRTDAPEKEYFVWSAGVHAQFVNGVAGFVSFRRFEDMHHLHLSDWTWGVRFEKSF